MAEQQPLVHPDTAHELVELSLQRSSERTRRCGRAPRRA
jgi:hypothetical protein